MEYVLEGYWKDKWSISVGRILEGEYKWSMCWKDVGGEVKMEYVLEGYWRKNINERVSRDEFRLCGWGLHARQG